MPPTTSTAALASKGATGPICTGVRAAGDSKTDEHGSRMRRWHGQGALEDTPDVMEDTTREQYVACTRSHP